MKNILFTLSVTIVTLFTSGCGEDRSQSDGLSTLEDENSWIYDNTQGQQMTKNGFVYVPGGFDVDGDENIDGGFWLSIYEARESNQTIDMKNNSKSIQTLISEKFQLYDDLSEYKKFNKTLSGGFSQNPISSLKDLRVLKVVFNDTSTILKGTSPLEAVLSLQNSQIKNGFTIGLPSEKQWIHLVKLVINNPKNWTGEEVGKGQLFQGNRHTASNRRYFIIENGLLGTDELVPQDYSVDVYDLSGSVAEWTSGMIAIEDRFLTGNLGIREYNEVNNAPLWWKPILEDKNILLSSIEGAGQYHDGSSLDGANDSFSVNFEGTKGFVDQYAVVARGGSSSADDKKLVGIGAANLSYGAGYGGPTVGFRAASDYLY